MARVALRTSVGQDADIPFVAVRLVAIVSASLVLVAGCGDDSTASSDRAEITVPDGFEVRVVADGFDGPTQIAVTNDGRLVVAEIADRRLDGRSPPDELAVVSDGDDFGYPRCVGDRTPVAELGATAADCADTPPSNALLEPGTTPTSVVVAPWDERHLLVALWNAGVVMSVPTTAGAEPHTGESTGRTRHAHPGHPMLRRT